jgi:peroxiredoxin
MLCVLTAVIAQNLQTPLNPDAIQERLRARVKAAAGLTYTIKTWRIERGKTPPPQITTVRAMKPNLLWSESDDECSYSDGTSIFDFVPRAKVYRIRPADPDGVWLPVGAGLYDFCAPKIYKVKYARASRQNFGGKKTFCLEFDEPEVPGLILKVYVDQKSDLPVGWEQVTADSIYRGIYTKIDLKTTYPLESFKWAPPSDAVDNDKVPRVSKLLKPGAPAPALPLSDLNGKPIDLPALWKKNRGLLLCFWYYGCGYSQRELKYLATIQKRAQDQGLEFIYVNRDDSPNVLKQFLKATKYDMRIGTDGQKLANAYGVVAYPTLYLINSSGDISYCTQGYAESDRPEIENEIAKLGIKL